MTWEAPLTRRLLSALLLCGAASAQIVTVNNEAFASARSKINSNFSYVNTQLGLKQASNTFLSALSGLTATNSTFPMFNGTTLVGIAIPDCANTTTGKLLYTAATRTFTCGTDQDTGGGGSYAGVTSDGSNGLTVTGAVAAASFSSAYTGVAQTVELKQGTAPSSPGANSFQLRTPTSIGTAYFWTLPGADAAGVIASDGSGVLSVKAINANNGIAGLDSGGKLPAANTQAAGLNGVLKYTSGVPSAIGTSSTNCVHEDGTSGACGSTITRSFGGDFGTPGGSALSSGSTSYLMLTVPFACTIVSWDIMADAGTATVKLWKVATGTAIPTSSNSINTSGLSLSTGTAIHSTTLTDFTTTSITANDIVAFNLSAVATAKYVSVQVNCQ
jgi:hypothetical protein